MGMVTNYSHGSEPVKRAPQPQLGIGWTSVLSTNK